MTGKITIKSILKTCIKGKEYKAQTSIIQKLKKKKKKNSNTNTLTLVKLNKCFNPNTILNFSFPI